MDIELLKWGVVRHTLYSTMNRNELVVVVPILTNGEIVLSVVAVIPQSVAIKISIWQESSL